MSNNSWKQFGGISKVNSFNVVNTSTLVADQFVSRSAAPGDQFFNGSMEITVNLDIGNDLTVHNDLVIRNSVSTIVDMFINGNTYINHKLFFFTKDRTIDASVVDLSSVVAIDASHAFINGTHDNIGINVIHPQTVFHISCDISDTTDILMIESSNNYIRNILGQNRNQRGMVIDASDDNTNIFIYNDTSTNKLNIPSAKIQYASGGFLSIHTEDKIDTRSRQVLFTTSGGILSMDGSGTFLDSSASIVFDTSASFILDSSLAHFHMDSSSGLTSIGTSGDFILHSSASGGVFKLNKEVVLLTSSGEMILNASGGLITMDATTTGEIKLTSGVFNLQTGLNFTPPTRDISANKMYNETITIFDNSNDVFAFDVYDLSNILTGHALTAIAKDPNSNADIKIIAPNNGRGSHFGGGVYPQDTNRAMGTVGLTDICLGFIPNQMMVSSTNRAKYLSTLGINTYMPQTEKYIMDVNGPLHINNGDINTILKTKFEIHNSAFSRQNSQIGFISGTPSSITDTSYTQMLVFTKDGGETWELSNIFEQENQNEAAETDLDANVLRFKQGFIIDNSYGFIGAELSNFLYTKNAGKDWYRFSYGSAAGNRISTAITGTKFTLDGSEIYRIFNASNETDGDSFIRSFDISSSNIDATLNESGTLNVSSDGDALIPAVEGSPDTTKIGNVTSMDISGQYLYVAGEKGIAKLDATVEPMSMQQSFTIHDTADGITSLNYNHIFTNSDTQVLAVGDNLLSLTTDGTNWIDTSLNAFGDVSLNKCFVYDSSNAVIVGERGTFLYSRDWTNINSWAKVPSYLLNNGGTENRLLDISHNLRTAHMPNKSTVLIGDAFELYDETSQLGSGNIQYTFLPNMFNRDYNYVLEASGSAVFTGDINIYEGHLYVNDIDYKPLDYTDVSGSITVGRNTLYTNIGHCDVPDQIFQNVPDNLSTAGTRTLSGEYQVINIGACEPSITNNVPPQIINIGNFRPYEEAKNHRSNMIYIGGGMDKVIIDGSGIEFKTETEITVNSTHMTLNFTAGELPNTGLGCGIKIKNDDDTRAGYIESSLDRTGYVMKAPSAKKELNQNVVKIDCSNLVLNDVYDTTNSDISGSFFSGYHGTDRGIVVLKKITNDGIDASFNLTVEQFDLSNILIRDSDIYYSNNNTQKINTGLIVGQDLSINERLYVGKDVIIDGNLYVEQYENRFIINTTTSQYNFLTVQEDMSLNGRLFVRDDVSMNSRLFVKDRIAIGNHEPLVTIDLSGTTDGIRIPKGETGERVTMDTINYQLADYKGIIRYNTSTDQFEGFGAGPAWGSLGGVIDVDQDTFISAENQATEDNDQLKFHCGDNTTPRMIIGDNGDISMNHNLKLNSDNGQISIGLLDDVVIKHNSTAICDISAGKIQLTSNIDEANAIYLQTNKGTSETITILNNTGTANNAIALTSTAGGVDITANWGIAVTNNQGTASDAIAIKSTVGGVAITGKNSTLTMNTDGDVALTANTASTDNITITNTQGTDDAAISLTSTVGGVAITGKTSSLTMATAGDIALTANTAATDHVTITNTQGTNPNAIALTSTAGGVDITGNWGVKITSQTIGTANDAIAITSDAGGVAISANGTTAPITFTTNSSERMRIFSDGTVGINTTIDSTYTLDVNGTVQASSYNATSDERLKENILPLEEPLSKINQLEGVHFHWTGDVSNNLNAGLLAQNVEKFIPEAVSTSSCKNEKDFYQKSVNYNAIIPYLVESIKTLHNEADILKHENEALKEKMKQYDTWFAELLNK